MAPHGLPAGQVGLQGGDEALLVGVRKTAAPVARPMANTITPRGPSKRFTSPAETVARIEVLLALKVWGRLGSAGAFLLLHPRACELLFLCRSSCVDCL